MEDTVSAGKLLTFCKWLLISDGVSSRRHVGGSTQRHVVAEVEEVVARQDTYSVALREHFQADCTLHLLVHPGRLALLVLAYSRWRAR